MTDPRKKERIRVLVADDQPHILEAVELLLQPQGMQVDSVRSPQLMLEALGQSDYDVLLIDLNYTRDTTSGKEGLDLLARHSRDRSSPSGNCDDRMGQYRSGRREHQARRTRFHSEAMGE